MPAYFPTPAHLSMPSCPTSPAQLALARLQRLHAGHGAQHNCSAPKAMGKVTASTLGESNNSLKEERERGEGWHHG